MKLPRLPFQMMRNQFIGLVFLGFLILLVQIFFYLRKEKKEIPIQIEIVGNTVMPQVSLSSFNPNDLSAEDWQKLGFTERQVKTILNYKELVGGHFASKEQLSKCYAISSEKFSELEPYILLPDKKVYKQDFQSFEKREVKVLGKFNPDDYNVEDWQRLGFSKKQSEAILKYKKYLGGSFRSKEKFKECFIISPENYKKLAPYIILPEISPEVPKAADYKAKINAYFNPNELDVKGWEKLGFTEKQANVIVNYREQNLKGSFKTLEDIQKCFVISSEKFQELKNWIKLPLKEEKEKKDDIQKSGTDFSKVDLNRITFKQLIEFGFEERSAASFIGFRKKLGGFVSKQQILEVYHINLELAKSLMEKGNLDNSTIQKYSLKDIPEDILKNHPYFKKYGDKIVYYRITFPSDKEIFNKTKASPEEIAKMKLYLK